MSRRAHLLLTVLALTVPTVPMGLTAQTVRGVLVDEHTGDPIALGRVMLVTPGRDSITATLTDERGYFELAANEGGTFSLVAEAFGYWSSLIGPIDLTDGADRIVEARRFVFWKLDKTPPIADLDPVWLPVEQHYRLPIFYRLLQFNEQLFAGLNLLGSIIEA